MPAFHSQNNKLQQQPNSRSILTSLTRDSVLFSVQFSPTLCDTMDYSTQASLSITNSRSLLKLLSIESVMPSNHPILCHPLLIPCQSFPASGSFQMSQFFASGSQSSASASVLPMNIQGLFPLGWTGWSSLQFQGTLKSLLQHHSSNVSILWRSAFFIVQLSHPYMTTGKTVSLTRWTFVAK